MDPKPNLKIFFLKCSWISVLNAKNIYLVAVVSVKLIFILLLLINEWVKSFTVHSHNYPIKISTCITLT